LRPVLAIRYTAFYLWHVYSPPRGYPSQHQRGLYSTLRGKNLGFSPFKPVRKE
jgi:hypothetical protein